MQHSEYKSEHTFQSFSMTTKKKEINYNNTYFEQLGRSFYNINKVQIINLMFI